MTAEIVGPEYAGRPIERAGAVFVLIAATLWAGLLVGVSFIATPAKFLAPSLTLPVALDVGRQTFSIFSRIEIGCAAVLAALVFMRMPRFASLAIVVLLATVVAAEAVFLIPALDARVAMIIAGQTPAPSSLHLVYILLEAVKVILLGVLVTLAMRTLSAAAARPRES